MPSENINQKVLKISIIFTTVFSIIALVVGYLIASKAVFVDGLFNLLGTATIIPTILAVKFIKKRNSQNYPFGKETFEPFIAIVNYCIIIYACIISIVDAVRMIVDGGNLVNAEFGILYGLFDVIFNVSVYGYLRFLNKNQSSAIAEAEVVGWKFTTLNGLGILIGFGISWGLNIMGISSFSIYVDPIMTIIIVLVFVSTPIFAMKNCLRELMSAAPPEEIASLINEKVDKADQDYSFSKKTLRLGKTGDKVIIEIDYVIKGGSKLDSVSMQDQLRSHLIQSFVELPHEKWVNIGFTNDIKWTEHSL